MGYSVVMSHDIELVNGISKTRSTILADSIADKLSIESNNRFYKPGSIILYADTRLTSIFTPSLMWTDPA